MPEFESFDEPYINGRDWIDDAAPFDEPCMPDEPFMEEDLGIPDIEGMHVSHLLDEPHFEEVPVVPTVAKAGPAERFLHERDPRFHASAGVEAVAGYMRDQGVKLPNQPPEKITSYLDLSADPEYGNDGIITGDEASLEYQVEARVIKAEAVPDSYFKLQQRIAREQGHGDVPMTDGMRKLAISQIQEDQRASLRFWTGHLSQTAELPDWFKQYAWDGLGKLGAYNKDYQSYVKGCAEGILPEGTKEPEMFVKRGSRTVAPYPELNHEALAHVLQWLQDGRLEGDVNQLTDETLRRHVSNGQFGKLYGYALTQIKIAHEAAHLSGEGSWRVFKQSRDPHAVAELTSTLQGHGTGWCTANPETAGMHLQNGDFHVYYTQNEQGEYAVPRVAIRMESGKIAEVRGIENNQDLEPDMTAVAGARLETMPDNEEYRQKAHDMQKLTALERQLKENPTMPLDRASLRFLYEYDRDIEGFADRRDPRILELRSLRKEVDTEPLKELLVESVGENIESAVCAYQEVAAPLAGTRFGITRKVYTPPEETVVRELFMAQHKAWEAAGLYDFIAREMQYDGGRYELLATPNVAVSDGRVMELVERFAGGAENMRIDEDIDTMHFSGQPLSKRQGSGPVRFSLLAVRPESKIGSGRPAEHVEWVDLWRGDMRGTGIHVSFPTVLDAVTLWHTLRSRGEAITEDMTRMDYPAIKIPPAYRTDAALRTVVRDDGGVALEVATSWSKRHIRLLFN